MTAPERMQAAIAALRENSITLAIEQLEALLAEHPSHPAGLLYLGIAYARADRLREAERTLSRARAVAPVEPLPHYNLGRLYYRLGQPMDSARCYQEALRLDPHHTPSREGLAELKGVLTPELLRERPLAEQQRVRAVDLLSVIRLSLLFGLLTTALLLLVSGGFAVYESDYALLAVGGVFGLMMIPSILISALMQALVFNLAIRWLGGVGVEMRCLREDWFQLREIDSFALARIWTGLGVVYALLQILMNLPSLLIMMVGTAASAGPAAVGVMVGMLLFLLLSNILMIGATFAGSVLACAFYNALAGLVGGIRFEHRFVDRQSEVRRIELLPALLTVAGIHAPLLPFFWLLCVLLAPEQPDVAVALAVGLPLLALLLGGASIGCYNLFAMRFGGLRLELQPD